MPPTLHSRTRLLLGAAAAAAATFAAPAGASAATTLSKGVACQGQAVTSPFKAWGDNALYWLAPGGDFETAAKGWTLKGAKVVKGNEDLGIRAGLNSLQFPAGTVSDATTPEFCVDPTHPQFRFVIKSTASTSVVETKINFRATTGATLTVSAKVNTYGIGKWNPSSSQPLATKIPSVFLGAGTTASISFHVTAVGGPVNIDNLLIDPYRRG